MRLLILGPPGAGKGTQAARIAAHYGIAHVSTGEMFRAQTGELGDRVAEIMKKGEYVRNDITIEMLKRRLAEPDAQPGFILDGFPRTDGQASALDGALGPDGLDAVVVLEVPEEELIARLGVRGRADDSNAAIRRRLEVYTAETEPLIGFYEAQGLVRTVGGVGAIEDITERIVEALSS